ncbi:MAG: hypothetical protein JWM19_1816 [Actinomycetia bacterium]|nr:hypothetical protein [Actinomycetes bacterium]
MNKLPCNESWEKGDNVVAAVLEGVKVIEVAGWTFVPAGGGVLADWGELGLDWDAIVALELSSTVN